jgi:hypothetical protein
VVVFYATVAAWAVFEVVLRIRERVRGQGGAGHDRATRILLSFALGAAVAVAALAARGRSLHLVVPALIVAWIGFALRIWAVVTLGRAFRTTVEVAPSRRSSRAGRTGSCHPLPHPGRGAGVLGEPYLAYEREKKRLIRGIW